MRKSASVAEALEFWSHPSWDVGACSLAVIPVAAQTVLNICAERLGLGAGIQPGPELPKPIRILGSPSLLDRQALQDESRLLLGR